MNSENNYNPNNMDFTEDNINLREEFEKYIYHWKWFMLSVVITIVIAFIYLRYSTNEYEVSSKILIHTEGSGGLGSELSAFEDIGLFNGSQANLENEIELLKSRTLFQEVAQELNLNINYYKEGRVKQSEIYSNESPIKINFFNRDTLFYEVDTTFIINPISNVEYTLTDENGNNEQIRKFGENVNLRFGEFTVTPAYTNKSIIDDEIIISISPIKNVVNAYINRFQIQPVNKNADVILLTLKDPVKSKAKAILDNLVKNYNENAVEDKSLVAKNTDRFINERLDKIEIELGLVEKGVEEFKTKNRLTDIPTESQLTLETNVELSKKIVDLSTQIRLAQYVEEYMTTNESELIPENLGLSDETISASTLKYNELILERNRILKSSTLSNPIIIQLNQQIDDLRNNIQTSLRNLKSSLQISLQDVKRQEAIMNSKIASVPKYERQFREIERQQSIIEALYLYLLKKREENSITLAATLPNSKIIDKAYGSDIPVSPKRQIILLAALLLGLIIPFGVIYLKNLFDTKVHTRKDIEAVLNAPILGDIPKTKSENKIVVSNEDRSSIAEAFRLLRTNINFMFTKVKGDSKSIFITSTLGGEGKTFLAINLASVLALSSKKVLLIGADIRKPKVVEYLKLKKGKGLTTYLTDNNVGFEDVVENVSEYNFDMIHSGIVPPNPAELLMNDRFKEILDYGKANYDYVIVDTAPVSLVTDTLLISEYADLFIYVIRANYVDKRLLEIPKKLYEENRLPNMSVLINEADYERGYGYGYGYGYSQQTDNRKWYQKLWKK